MKKLQNTVRNFLEDVCEEFERLRGALSPLVKEVDSTTGAEVVTEDLEIRFEKSVFVKDDNHFANKHDLTNEAVNVIVEGLETKMHKELFNSLNNHVSDTIEPIILKCLSCNEGCPIGSLVDIIPSGKSVIVSFGINCFKGESAKRQFIDRVRDTQIEIINLPLPSTEVATMFIMSESDAPSLNLNGYKNKPKAENVEDFHSSGIWAADMSDQDLVTEPASYDALIRKYTAKVYADMSITWKTEAEVTRVNLTRAACQA